MSGRRTFNMNLSQPFLSFYLKQLDLEPFMMVKLYFISEESASKKLQIKTDYFKNNLFCGQNTSSVDDISKLVVNWDKK